LHASHHPVGFDKADIDQDIVPATSFVVFPKNKKATEFTLKQFKLLGGKESHNDHEKRVLRAEEESDLQTEEREDILNPSEVNQQKSKTFFSKTQLHSVIHMTGHRHCVKLGCRSTTPVAEVCFATL